MAAHDNVRVDPGERVDPRDRPLGDTAVLLPAGPEATAPESDEDRAAAEQEMNDEAVADHVAARQQAERAAETESTVEGLDGDADRGSPDETMVANPTEDAARPPAGEGADMAAPAVDDSVAPFGEDAPVTQADDAGSPVAKPEFSGDTAAPR